MKRLGFATTFALISVPAAPPPGSPAIYKSDAELTAGLKAALARAAEGAQISAGISTTDQYRINLVQRRQGAGPLTHAGNTELHYITEGARRVTKGDVIVVPADTPHWYKEVEGVVTYLEVRFVVPTK
jgi:hypothetical protein